MDYTGERFLPTEKGKIRLEHYHRYAVVLDIVQGQRVLDIASGEGYGSHLLASRALSVTGVDVSAEAVEHARDKYQAANLQYSQGSALALDFPDATFDVVISFETIEHLSEQSDMLFQLRRVLKPEGVLVISSPNRPVFAKEQLVDNTYHVKELDFSEFDELLKSQFGAVKYYGQKMLTGSTIQSLEVAPKNLELISEHEFGLQSGSGVLAEPIYFMALCANAADQLPSLKDTVFQSVHVDMVDEYLRALRSFVAMEKEARDLWDEVQSLGKLSEMQKMTISRQELRFQSILNSRSWRITKPLRFFSSWLRKGSE